MVGRFAFLVSAALRRNRGAAAGASPLRASILISDSMVLLYVIITTPLKLCGRRIYAKRLLRCKLRLFRCSLRGEITTSWVKVRLKGGLSVRASEARAEVERRECARASDGVRWGDWSAVSVRALLCAFLCV